MKIKALNEFDSSDSASESSATNDVSDVKQAAPSKEALEEQYFEKYSQALKAIKESKSGEANKLLIELNDQLDEIDSSQATLQQLQYSVLKNLAYLENGTLFHFLKALKIDSTDVSLLIRTGEHAVRVEKYELAKDCFERALQINPENWVALDRLLDIYYLVRQPNELYDACARLLAVNRNHKKAQLFIGEAKKMQPLCLANEPALDGPLKKRARIQLEPLNNDLIQKLERVQEQRRHDLMHEIRLWDSTHRRLSLTLDSARTQSLNSLGNYIIKVYERFARSKINRNTLIDLTLNSILSISQNLGNNSANSPHSNNMSCDDPQSLSNQGAEANIEGEGTSASDNDKGQDPSRNGLRAANNASMENESEPCNRSNSRSKSNQTASNTKSSGLSFAAMLFPMDLGDKRRSSRNRSNQDDTFSFKMKFDELNDILPEGLRIGSIEQALQRRRDEQQRLSNEEKQEEIMVVETNLEPAREDLIIKSIIETLTSGAPQPFAPNGRSDIRLSDVFFVYLSHLSTKKQNNLPEAFAKAYRIYRKLCPLPRGVFVEIGPDTVTLDELWFTLTANETQYSMYECNFLLKLLEMLQLHLDEMKHREFSVRLFVILGLNHDYKYFELALEQIEEDTRIYASNRKIITRAYIKTLIEKANEKLQHEAEESDQSIDIINRLAPKSENEMSEREILSLCNAIRDAEIWQRGLNILNQRNDLNSDVIIDMINLCLKNGATMDAILASKLCKEAISGSRPTTWTCLYRGWRGFLSKEEFDCESNIRNVSKFFELGHQTLGKKAVCTVDKGDFLMQHVKHLLEDCEDFEEREILGPLHCLFNYPTKRPISVVGHKAVRVPMTWEFSEIVYPYLVPEELPTYMSLLRKVGISSEMEVMFKEVIATIPSHADPTKEVRSIMNFIEKGEPLTDHFSIKPNEVTKDVYYFLADYHFKNKSFKTAREYYCYDLALNPNRFDSWAALSLILANDLDKGLRGGTVTTQDFMGGPFRRLVDSAIRCFSQATRLKPNEPKATLWIEFGNLTYNLTSLAARLLAYDEFEASITNVKLADSHELAVRHKYLYNLAKNCFKSANKLCHSEEVWLHYYMLGKIHEKLNAFKALEYYARADSQLFHEGASYPKKINYHSPPELAYEAMEVHYRIHSTVLKFLLDDRSDIEQTDLDRLKRFLLNAQRSPFVVLESVPEPQNHVMEDAVIKQDVELLISDLCDSVDAPAEFNELIFMCLHGMKRCLVRCDKNFKALYRLSHYYRKIGDYKIAQEILTTREMETDARIPNLLARRPGVPVYLAAPPDLKGIDSLFKDRKLGNLFFNIWRIPIEEVDRLGSFEHWMYKSTQLLIEVSTHLDDTNMLTIIAFQLSRQPETSKKYLHDRARILLAKYAVISIEQIIDRAIDRANSLEERRCYVREGLVIADRFIKANVFADQMRTLQNRLQGAALA